MHKIKEVGKSNKPPKAGAIWLECPLSKQVQHLEKWGEKTNKNVGYIGIQVSYKL